MNELVNEAIIELLNAGRIDKGRLVNLIYIREFIDRVSTRNYIEEKTARELHEKYGVYPNLITWGDYFQSELATALADVSDEEFTRAIETVKFDIMASYIIFCEKTADFFEWVDETYEDAVVNCCIEMNEEEVEEIAHLKILKDYFVDLGLVDNFTEDERNWYNTFNESAAM